MTASERLRELTAEAEIIALCLRNPVIPNVYDGEAASALERTRNLLPLITDVVEAAERYVMAEDADDAAMRRLLDAEGDEDDNRDAQKETRLAADAAYNALTPALTALRDALEEK